MGAESKGKKEKPLQRGIIDVKEIGFYDREGLLEIQSLPHGLLLNIITCSGQIVPSASPLPQDLVFPRQTLL